LKAEVRLTPVRSRYRTSDVLVRHMSGKGVNQELAAEREPKGRFAVITIW
jgi:hypothetical protein